MQPGRKERKLEPCPYVLRKTTDLIELIKIYEQKAEGVISRNTIDNVICAIKDLMAITGKTDITEVNDKDFEKFKSSKIRKGIKNSSINNYFFCFEHFWNLFGLELKLQRLQEEKDRVARIRKQILTMREFQNLLEVIDNMAFKAAVAIMFERGVRVGKNSNRKGYPRRGLLGLNWGDVNFENGTMEVQLKGNKVQIIPLGELSEKYLIELKETGNRGKIGPNDPVFVTLAGKRLGFERFRWKLINYMKNAKIPKEKRRARAFRHTCGTWITKEYGVYTAKEVLGHSHLQTTEIYVHLADDDLMQKLRPDKANKVNTLEKPQMKKCPKCGAELTPDRTVCICGYDFTQNRCPNCGAPIERGSNFCPFCGERLGPPQPECVCGHPLNPEYKVCPKCGRSLDEIKKLWDSEDLKKWNGIVRNKKNVENLWNQKNPEKSSGKSKDSIEEKQRFSSAKLDEVNPKPLNLNSEHHTDHCELNGANSNLYQVQIVSNKEQPIKLLEEDWELVKEISTGEFVMRKRNTILES